MYVPDDSFSTVISASVTIAIIWLFTAYSDLMFYCQLINKKCITREQFFNQELQKFINYDCRDHLPIPPIEIIVDTAINEGLINLSNSASAL